jgi:putative ABC transport system permease protein
MHGTLPASPPQRRNPASSLPLLLRLALRELRGGLKGFGIFLACIALGVAAIAGVSSLSRSLTEGISREGRRILGGDMAFSLLQREASEAERAFSPQGAGSIPSRPCAPWRLRARRAPPWWR